MLNSVTIPKGGKIIIINCNKVVGIHNFNSNFRASSRNEVVKSRPTPQDVRLRVMRNCDKLIDKLLS